MAKRLELRGDFGRNLGSRLAAHGDNRPERRHIGAKRAVGVDQMAKPRCRQYRPAFHQHHMQADTQCRHAPRARNGIRCRRRRDHQAGSGENTAAVRRFDGFVDFARRAEIVRRDDQSLQAVSCRVRRK